METVSSQTPIQAQTSQTPGNSSTASRNFKNWFDEFKAKVSKKSQNNQVTNSDQADEFIKDDSQASVIVPGTTSAAPLNPIYSADLTSTPLASQAKFKSSSLRARKPNRLTLTDVIDSEISPSHKNVTGRDKQSSGDPRRRQNSRKFSKLFSIFSWIVSFIIPFDYTLPWKLICLVNSCFVIIVIGLASGSSQVSTAFNFCNGFLCGLLVATICFIILGLSFVVRAMPKSQDAIGSTRISPNISVKDTHVSLKNNLANTFDDLSSKNNEGDRVSSHHDITIESRTERNSEDFSLFEILDQESTIGDSSFSYLDEDYRGWMIEFIGDYEQRNTSEIKLKSIFVHLENRILHLCKPKNSHDIDTTTLPLIANQRVYDLNSLQKFSANLLIPKNVRNKQKYVWSKKYPIRLEFLEAVLNETGTGKVISDSGPKTVTLTLFAKSCREKEEWFRRFKRIVESNRLTQGHSSSTKLPALPKTDETSSNISNSESLFDSFRRFRRRSPSFKRDCVQPSQSSHLLADPKRTIDDLTNKKSDKDPETSSSPSASLIRTKSCEILDSSRPFSSAGRDEDQVKPSTEDYDNDQAETGADDSTLTRETAELFSQAIEYSNFIDSQPTLDYRDFIERTILSSRDATPTSDWFNALTARIFFDVLSHNHWSEWFKKKIQRKLYRIRLPYFMETLTLTTIDLGTSAPHFLNVVSHSFNSYGLSIDFDMSYSGGLTMTFETKLNLLKIKTDNSSAVTTNTNANYDFKPNIGPQVDGQPPNQDKSGVLPENFTKEVSSTMIDPGSSSDNVPRELLLPSAVGKSLNSSSSASIRTSGGSSTSDSETSDSDSSSDSSIGEPDAYEISDWEDYGAEKTRQNIVKFVDKIASSRYFQHATENRYIKKKLQDISNCPLVLIVQIQSLNGVLTLNVPPPQTDRIWYGFKPTPELVLKAIPKMGDREVSLSHVTDWIERKLAEEFKKILVMPNMEDIILPVLKSDHLQYVTPTK